MYFRFFSILLQTASYFVYADIYRKDAEREMTKIENEKQYEWAVSRVEQLLPLVTDSTPRTAPNSIELELLSNLVADYSEEHFDIGKSSLLHVIQSVKKEDDFVATSL